MSDLGVNLFSIFEQYPDEAPKNIEEMLELEQKCRDNGKETLAEYLEEWRIRMEYHKNAEWSEPHANT